VILLELLFPESGACLRHTEIGTTHVSVPEAAVNEDGHPPPWEHQIGSAGEVPPVQLVPESGAP
jgi:hypothetical protein